MLTGGAALALLAASHDARVAFAGAFALGMAAAATLVPGHTLVQELTPRELLGRVMSSIVAVVGLAQGASMAASGAAAGPLGTRWVLAGGALLAGCIGVIALWLPLTNQRRGHSDRSSAKRRQGAEALDA
jgi:MFS family permease